jgi:hypothetical protein
VATLGLLHHLSDHVERREVPDEALNKHVARGLQLGRGPAHFLEEASRLIQWEGDLDALEAEYRDRRRAQIEGEAEPTNPWGCRDVPTPRAARQLRMTGGIDEER